MNGLSDLLRIEKFLRSLSRFAISGDDVLSDRSPAEGGHYFDAGALCSRGDHLHLAALRRLRLGDFFLPVGIQDGFCGRVVDV